jgi:hypothetical protein
MPRRLYPPDFVALPAAALETWIDVRALGWGEGPRLDF